MKHVDFTLFFTNFRIRLLICNNKKKGNPNKKISYFENSLELIHETLSPHISLKSTFLWDGSETNVHNIQKKNIKKNKILSKITTNNPLK